MISSSNLLILCIVAILIYVIYNHFKLTESFSLQEFVATKNTLISTHLNSLDSAFNSAPIMTTDKVLYDLYSDSLDQKTTVNNDYTLSQAELASAKSDLNFLDGQLSQLNIPTPKYQSIKSLQNGIDINIASIDDKGNYMVQVNKKCLTASGGFGNYGLSQCNKADLKQKFAVSPIYNYTYYNNILENNLDSSNVVAGDKYPYPFMVVKSVNTGDCLQNNYGSLSIEPCQIRKSQRWLGINNPVLCK
jgi:hypothetical protein